MNKIFKYMAGVLIASFAMTACSPEDFTGANGDIPQASDYADNFKNIFHIVYSLIKLWETIYNRSGPRPDRNPTHPAR